MLAAIELHASAPLDEALRQLVTASPAVVLHDALDLIDTLYGTPAGLLTAHGFADTDLARLREALTH
jgi:hypothetical protein